MSTINIQYPLQEYLQSANYFRFDKSLDSKGTVKVKFALTMT